MSTHHHHHHHHHHEKEVSSSLWKAFSITAVFMAIELAGGLYSNSLALLSDAAHMLTDLGAMGLSLFAFWFARRPRTPRMSFGYYRVEILGALLSGLTIWLIAGYLVYEAVQRMLMPEEVKGPVVFFVALAGLCANLISMRVLHHAQEHHLNVKAAYLHLIADSLGSVGAVIAGAVLWWTGWRPIDPIITVIFSALMVFSSWELIKEAIGILMEGTPSSVDPMQVREDLLVIPSVKEVHDLHIWTVSSGKVALSVHLISHGAEKVLQQANELLRTRHGIVHTTIQVEDPEKFRSERCYDCAPS